MVAESIGIVKVSTICQYRSIGIVIGSKVPIGSGCKVNIGIGKHLDIGISLMNIY